MGRPSGGLGVARRHQCARRAELGDDIGALLGVGIGAADVGDDRQVASGALGVASGVAEHLEQTGNGVVGRAVAEHDVDQQHRRGRIGGVARDALVAQRRVDHRVGAALGELVVAHVDDGVLAADPDVVERWLPATGVLDQP